MITLKSVCDSLALSVNALLSFPHITTVTTRNKDILYQALTKLGDVLSESTDKSLAVIEANLALQSLVDASAKISSLVSKWNKRRIRIVLNKCTFVEELSNGVMEVQKSCGQLQVCQNYREAAIEIGEQLNAVLQGLKDGGRGNTAEAQFKEELLDFVRSSHSKSKTLDDEISIVTWLARYLDTDVNSIEQDLQEMKENMDTSFSAQRDTGTELLEQLILSLYDLDILNATLANTKAKLICHICSSQMISPVVIDSGRSFCEACIEERFRRGSMTCPETRERVNNSFVVNYTLVDVVAGFRETEEQPGAESFTEDGESSDASLSRREISDFHVDGETLDRQAQIGLENLDSPDTVTVQMGFNLLIRCASSPGGRLAVSNARYTRPPPASPAQVIPTVIEKVKQDSKYSHPAVKFLAALTSSEGDASQRWDDPDSLILKDDALNFIISLLNEAADPRTRILAAETLANILVRKEVRNFVRCKEGVVPSLVGLSNAHLPKLKDREKANSFGLKGLQRLAKCSTRGIKTKTKMIVLALINLLRKGLSYKLELKLLVTDSLVALDNQILAMDHGSSTSEVRKVVWKEMKEHMTTEGILVSHVSVLGRKAIINIMWKLCDLDRKEIDERVVLTLLQMMTYTRSEIESLSGPFSQSLLPQEGVEKLKDLTDLVNRSIRLLCFCVTHGQSAAQNVLSGDVWREKGRILEELLVHGDTSDDSRLKIYSILEQIDNLGVKSVTTMVKISKSENLNCRLQAASKLRMLVEGKQYLTEFKQAEGIAALLLLLKDPNLSCRKDALVALQALPTSTAIPVGQLPLESILDFLIQEGPKVVTNAAIGLFAMMVKGKAVSDDKFLESEGALEAILRLTGTDCQKSASALLVMANEYRSIRTRIAEPRLRGLGILVEYVRDHGDNEVKELLTATLVLLCKDGETYQKAVIEADGHRFLIASLEERISKEEAAQGLLELIKNTCTIEIVLDGGFVTTAMRTIDHGRFACTDIALALSHISSLPKGLDQIYSESSSVSALLILLDHCPHPAGKKAAALIISRLYPRLHREHDSARRERITDKCQRLLDYLDSFGSQHVKDFLQALAVLAAEPDGRKTIHQTRGHERLINHLSGPDTEIQGLVLKILSEMSSNVSRNGVEAYDARMIRVAFLDIKVGEKVFGLLKSDGFFRRTESMKDALMLIRNMSVAGSYASSQLVKEDAVSALLEVLKLHERFLPIVTELALKALEGVLDNPEGKAAFKKGGGVRILVSIVEVDASTRERDGDAFGRASIAIIILTQIGEDPHHRRHAFETILNSNILSALNKIIFSDQPGKIKWHAAVLMKQMAMFGPSKVFVAIKDKGCLDALISLRDLPDLNDTAVNVLSYLGDNNRACRSYIQERGA